jgi:uncharacterized protein
MAATVQDNPDLARYEIFEDGELAGFADYKRSDGAISLRHTEVDDRFEGRGLGSTLAREVLGAARADGVEVLPHCPFMAAYIREHPDDYLSLVPEDRRSQFGL